MIDDVTGGELYADKTEMESTILGEDGRKSTKYAPSG